MSDKTTFQRYADRFGGGPDSAAASDADRADDLGEFGFLRGIRNRAEMLELYKKTGNKACETCCR